MAKIDPKVFNPQYEQIKSEQTRLAEHYVASSITVARICPYCTQKLSLLSDGQHDAIQQKCPNCGEQINLPPVHIG